jgi:hypothetical protein
MQINQITENQTQTEEDANGYDRTANDSQIEVIIEIASKEEHHAQIDTLCHRDLMPGVEHCGETGHELGHDGREE